MNTVNYIADVTLECIYRCVEANALICYKRVILRMPSTSHSFLIFHYIGFTCELLFGTRTRRACLFTDTRKGTREVCYNYTRSYLEFIVKIE